jgi:hypothetical protein
MPFFLPSTGPISLDGQSNNSISYVFGPKNGITSYGYDLNGYVGQRWYKLNGQTGLFTEPLDFDSFHGTGPFAPVVPGGYRLYINGYYPGTALPSGYTDVPSGASGTVTIPNYVNLTIDVYGSSGGGGGGAGNGGSGGDGGTGGSTTFGSSTWYVSGSGGGGGTGSGRIDFGGVNGGPGVPGTGSVGYPVGGSGGASNLSFGGNQLGGMGGAGGHSRLLVTNPLYGVINPYTGLYTPLGPSEGSVVSWVIGAVGGGGGGGPNSGILWHGNPGASGNYGWIDIGWS